jgi:hypothetical protein
MKKIYVLVFMTMTTLFSANAQIVINEILYEIPGTGELEEFIELHNAGTSDVDMLGYSFTAGVTYTFGPVTIQAGAYYLLAANQLAMQESFGVNPDAIYAGALSNTGEDIVLVDNLGFVVDSVNYKTTSPWPTTASEGYSIQLCNASLDNNIGTSWGNSTIAEGFNTTSRVDDLYATPGWVNETYKIKYLTITAVACNSYTSPSGKIYTSTNTYKDTLNYTCEDSIFTINLTIQKSNAAFSVSACNSYLSPSGKYTWTQNGVYNDTIPNMNNCDSIMEINLTIKSTSSYIYADACDSYTSPSGKYTWTEDGIYTDTIPNANSCDSIMEINLTIDQSTSSYIYVDACNSYTSPSGRYTWTEDGIYTDTIPNANRCDSIMEINLTIKSTSSYIYVDACDSYTSPSGRYTWTEDGIYTDTIPNASSCDSIMKIDLVVYILDATVSQEGGALVTNEIENANYQWLDCDDNFAPILDANAKYFTPTMNGNYAVSINFDGCIDTSDCYLVDDVGIINQNTMQEISLFPNPISDNQETVTLALGENKDVSVSVFNISGELVFEKQGINESTFQFQLKEVAGIYTVVVKKKEEVKYLQLVKY